MVINTFKLEQNIHGKEIYEFIKQNEENESMKNFLEEYISNLSIGIANIINIFEPEAIALGGSFSYYEEVLLNKLKKDVENKLFNNSSPEIIVAKYKNDAGLLGATMLDKYQDL